MEMRVLDADLLTANLPIKRYLEVSQTAIYEIISSTRNAFVRSILGAWSYLELQRWPLHKVLRILKNSCTCFIRLSMHEVSRDWESLSKNLIFRFTREFFQTKEKKLPYIASLIQIKSKVLSLIPTSRIKRFNSVISIQKEAEEIEREISVSGKPQTLCCRD